MLTDPLFYACAVPAVLIVGISKGGFGGGLSVISVPLMALAISPPQAAAIMLPVLCVMDLYGLWVYRGQWEPRLLIVLLPGAMVGIAIGTALFHHLDDDAIRLLIGGLSIAFVADALLRKRRQADAPHRVAAWIGAAAGTLSGFTSFVAHAGGPPITAYFLTLGVEKRVFVATTVIFFTTVNYVKLVPYAWLGQLNVGNVETSVVLFPLAIAGVGLGAWLHRQIADALFRKIVLVLMTLSGLKLLYDGFGL